MHKSAEPRAALGAGVMLACVLALGSGDGSEHRVRWTPELVRVRDILASATESSSQREWDEFEQSVLDAGALAIPLLRDTALGNAGEAQRNFAAYGLALVGGPDAVDALRKAYRRDATLKFMLCFAMASTGSDEDRAFLKDALGPEGGLADRTGEHEAALALGVLRDHDAVRALERVAPESGSAEAALRWIRQGRWAVGSIPETDRDRDLIRTVLENGIPRMEEAREYRDVERRGVWLLDDGRWSFERRDHVLDRPTILLRTRRSHDGERAIVHARLWFGPRNGVGYDYVLHRRNGEWTITGVRLTWIT